jgi:transcriptional regulator
MYRPAAFDVPGADQAIDMIDRSPFGHLVSAIGGHIDGSALPFVADRGRGVLRAHFARANPHWRRLDAAPDRDPAVLVIFDVANTYVSPSAYPSKAEHGRVVPTWNYEAVHVRGTVRLHDDIDWVRSLVTDLTDRREAAHVRSRQRSTPWAVTDAPPDFVDAQLRAIVGVEVEITSIEGKRKLSQNRSEADRSGVLADLESSPDPVDQRVAEAMRAPD